LPARPSISIEADTAHGDIFTGSGSAAGLTL
jgi:hypothetical protein